ncbi:dTDP-4-amino-4,6-dideoxygalactose transaminase [Herbiconiux moechotypicola]|uniref:dTDP-4-amino-4,6-dideoxygalactose transaminase n=1 Tax=Herbiconiux moechotypicola TaxID=637393 RepID=A0ABP5QR37_9MICO|nr:dTDP-4-amino-4,6-dideoxygalactose transaminase [Herbiconiux moechotypicola]MCS5730994.1 dTDP-4-amino-4,6-dideoxygalactose transaminase [Herbiconiux moechotypicola]
MSAVAAADEIVFSRPFRAPGEFANLVEVLRSDHAHGDGGFTRRATARLRAVTGARDALLTTSCTHALELAGLLLGLRAGDEVVLPSFTFPSAATAVVARGATPVFADLDPATGNADPASVAESLTPRTRAVVVMHYGGVPVDLGAVGALCGPQGIALVEDNAHGLGGSAGDRMLGSAGVLATQSFHDTKNVHCGEGGALLVNDPALVRRAEIIREKGTNRARFLRGEVHRYTWLDEGSSYLPSELNAAVLDAQLAAFDTIQGLRHRVWNVYAAGLAAWARDTGVRLMSEQPGLEHTAHLFWLLLPDAGRREAMLRHLHDRGVRAAFHYVPLDTSPAGERFGRRIRPLSATAEFASRLVRLPLWPGLAPAQIERVLEAVTSFDPWSTAADRPRVQARATISR